MSLVIYVVGMMISRDCWSVSTVSGPTAIPIVMPGWGLTTFLLKVGSVLVVSSCWPIRRTLVISLWRALRTRRFLNRNLDYLL